MQLAFTKSSNESHQSKTECTLKINTITLSEMEFQQATPSAGLSQLQHPEASPSPQLYADTWS